MERQLTPYIIVLHIRLIEYFITTVNTFKLLLLVINCRTCYSQLGVYTYYCQLWIPHLYIVWLHFSGLLLKCCPKEHVSKDQIQMLHLQTRSVLTKTLQNDIQQKLTPFQTAVLSFLKCTVQAVQDALHLRNFSMGKTFFARNRSEYRA